MNCAEATKPTAGFRTASVSGEAELSGLESDPSPRTNGPISSVKDPTCCLPDAGKPVALLDAVGSLGRHRAFGGHRAEGLLLAWGERAK